MPNWKPIASSLVLLVLCVAAGDGKLPAKLEVVEQKYEAACVKAKAAYDKAIAEARKPYIAALRKELQEAKKRGDEEVVEAIGEKLATASGEALEAKVPDDAQSFDGHFYKLFKDKVTWPEAKAYCERQGGSLAVIETEDEAKFIRGIADTSWIGAALEKGKWYWVDGTPVKFTDWCNDEPSGGKEDAACGIDRGWNDLPHTLKRSFICEWAN